MKRTINNLILFVFLATCIAWINCGDDENPLEPSQLTGTYTFGSLTDKVDNSTTNAGDILDLDGPGALPEGAITGTLEFTETTFTFTFIITPAAAPPVTVTSLGTYTISDSTITVTTTSSTVPGIELGADTFTISLNGNRLTFEDDETRFVFDKQ